MLQPFLVGAIPIDSKSVDLQNLIHVFLIGFLTIKIEFFAIVISRLDQNLVESDSKAELFCFVFVSYVDGLDSELDIVDEVIKESSEVSGFLSCLLLFLLYLLIEFLNGFPNQLLFVFHQDLGKIILVFLLRGQHGINVLDVDDHVAGCLAPRIVNGYLLNVAEA